MAGDIRASVDPDLIAAVREGRLVLFLGAGASRGALNDKGDKIPDGKELGARLADKFLNSHYRDYDLKTIYDYACSRASVREVQRFMHDVFIGFQPTEAHMALPNFPWAGIATTNYDLLVERSYAHTPDVLVPYFHDGGADLSKLSTRQRLYLKLHGCITDYENVTAPLVTSTEQIINYQNGRANLFKRFLEWGQNNPIAFVGYAMSDVNLRTLLDQLIREGDYRPRHYIVRPGWDDIEASFWRDKRFIPLDADFAGFIHSLDLAIPKGVRQLGALAAAKRVSSLTRFINRSGINESAALLDALETTFEHVSSDMGETTGDAARFYAGVNQGWYPISAQLDAPRMFHKRMLASWILPPENNRTAFFLLKGHAGSGKSVSLKRLAWDAARKYEKLVFFLRSGAALDELAIEETLRITGRTLYLFVDDAADHYSDLRHLLNRALVKNWALVVVASERVNEWNVQESDDSEALANDEITLEYLTESEIEDILQLLEAHGALGELADLKFEDRVKAFQEYAGRQLLVALHEATRGVSFEKILEDEYNSIVPIEAKVLYLDICALHRFGPPVRAGLISRVHGIGFEEFEKKFFKPLAQVVVLEKAHALADYTYQARHSYIAETVFERAVQTTAEKFELLTRILSKLNPDYSYDRSILIQLVRARTIADLFPDRSQGRSIYDTAMNSVGRLTPLLHQKALYELRTANDRSSLDRADSLIREALLSDPNYAPLRHTLAEVALKRSTLARSPDEAAIERQTAASISRQLARTAKNSYAHHTLAKVMLAEFRDALATEEKRPSELASQAVNHAMQEAEAAIREGLSRHPNDPFMLMAESELSDLLSNAPRALAALQRAFASNPKSELVVNRLAIMLMARNESTEAEDVLKKALNANPGSRLLNLRYAKILMTVHPGIDGDDPEKILFHLKRATQAGDENLDAQYLLARQSFLTGKYSDAKDIFDRLSTKKLKYLSDVSGMVLTKEGVPRVYYGRVAYAEERFGFLDHVSGVVRVYFNRLGGLFENSEIKIGERVSYNLGFNLKGAVASNLALA